MGHVSLGSDGWMYGSHQHSLGASRRCQSCTIFDEVGEKGFTAGISHVVNELLYVDSDIIPIDSLAARMAVQFYVEEAWVRSNEAFPIYEVQRS